MVELEAVSPGASRRPERASRSILGLGTAVFEPGYGLGGSGRAQLAVLLRAAVDLGVKYVDTSPGYGEATEYLGQLADLLASREVRVCTKLPARQVVDGLGRVLARLRCDRLDTLLLHSASRRDLQNSDVVSTLEAAKRSGRVRLCGASTYGEADALLALSQPWCDVVQVEFSVLNPSVIHALIPRKRPGQEIVVRSVLAKGLLTERRAHAKHLDANAVDTLERLTATVVAWGLSLPELAIRFALDTAGIDVVLVGMSSTAELDTALRASARQPLEPWQREALRGFDRSDEDWVHPERWPVKP